MEVILAGYNIDASIIEALKRKQCQQRDITPETIAAAYARISRSPKRVDELRFEAQNEVESARRSNKNIVFDMGHSSIAEHAVFNIDVIGISRLLVEEVQRFRLCSFTEKSQRYVTFKSDFIVPDEIKGTVYESDFIETIQTQNKFYQTASQILVKNILEKNEGILEQPRMRSTLEGLAKEDARYALSLATATQFGMTINARNLELMIRRLFALPFSEAKEYAEKLLKVTKDIAPSLIRYTTATQYDKDTRASLRKGFDSLGALNGQGVVKRTTEVFLLEATPNADTEILAALLFSSSSLPFEECYNRANEMSNAQRKRIFLTLFQEMKAFDAPFREFENVDLLFELVVSASCFAQLKRHRMASIHCQPYDVSLGVKVPPAFAEVGLNGKFQTVTKKTVTTYKKIKAENEFVATYILTNAHRRRVLMALNARELYLISRLRMDKHAQWDIRNIATALIKQAKKVMPLAMMLATGKDAFDDVYKNIFVKTEVLSQK
ncbi:MAG: FAD-dependent thymidylate synthase [Deltaproteobacteria bacterium]